MLSRDFQFVVIGTWIEIRLSLGDVEEEVVARELEKMIWNVEPALDNNSGKLLPGCKAASVLSSFLLAFDEVTKTHRLAGLKTSDIHEARLRDVLFAFGYREIRI